MEKMIFVKDGDFEITKGSEDSSGFDVTAQTVKTSYRGDNEIPENRVKKVQKSFIDRGSIKIRPFERMLFGTGITVADLPKGVELQVRSRSGMALKKGLIVSNQPGTVDNDYRGEIGVILYNSTPFLVTVQRGERIAQIVPIKVENLEVEIAQVVTMTARGEGGFGSTGTL